MGGLDGDAVRIWLWVIFGILFLLRALFAALEYALTEVSDRKVQELAQKDSRWSRLKTLLEKPAALRTAFAMHRVFSCVLMTAVALLAVLESFSSLPAFLLGAVTVLVLAPATAALADLMPKEIARSRVETLALLAVVPVRVLMFLLAPMRCLVSGVVWLLRRMLGLPEQKEQEVVTEEEIRLLVDAGNETGVIEESHREMINNIFAFDDVAVSAVMTHRTDLITVERDTPIMDIVYLAINEGFSRMPVYENTIDTIVGIIYVKDLLCLVGCEHVADFTLDQFLRQVLFVPESCKCEDVFRRMTRDKMQAAMVVDEYGGTAGMVTMEDLLEEIVGNIQDEYDDEEAELTPLGDDAYLIEGAADPEEILPKLGEEPPSSFDTMSAFVVELLGRIPAPEEFPAVEWHGLRFTVMETEDHWISKLRGERIHSDAAEPE